MTLVSVKNLVKDYSLPRKYLLQKAPLFRALHGLNLEIGSGESFGIVGESGCGKSTLARLVMALEKPTDGTVEFEGEDLFSVEKNRLRQLRRQFQMVFQDPYGSLNPRKTILSIISEPLDCLEQGISKGERRERVQNMMKEVGLNPAGTDRYPHEFSGGQRQRIAIARALITHPALIVADESVSALDVSVQAQVLNLMMDLQEKYNLSLMFISHDLSVVEFITEKIAVIYLGRIVEMGATEVVFDSPGHPYTRMLLDAIPSIVKKPASESKPAVSSILPATETGCPFASRCRFASDDCLESVPRLEPWNNRRVACHRINDIEEHH